MAKLYTVEPRSNVLQATGVEKKTYIEENVKSGDVNFVSKNVKFRSSLPYFVKIIYIYHILLKILKGLRAFSVVRCAGKFQMKK